MPARGREWLSIRDAARVAGVHPNTVRVWVREGLLRSEITDGKHGPTYRIDLEDLPQAESPPKGGHDLLDRLAAAEEARLEEARGRARAEARLEGVDDVRAALAAAREEIRRVRARLARQRKD